MVDSEVGDTYGTKMDLILDGTTSYMLPILLTQLLTPIAREYARGPIRPNLHTPSQIPSPSLLRLQIPMHDLSQRPPTIQNTTL